MCYDGFGQLLWGKPDIMPAANLNISYTDFRKMDTLSEGDKKYAVTYGVDNERRKSVYSVNGSTVQTTYYVGNYEEQINALGNIRKIHYISGGAVLIQNNGKDSLLYGYTDNQGSLIALTDTAGNVIEKYAYDPWGLRRNPSDWTQADSRNKWIINRGYTGQEHIDAFGIINMNGRVYDPQTAMFFSPDPFVQSAGDWLNYNRYSYVMNNPTRYTDPSGYQYLMYPYYNSQNIFIESNRPGDGHNGIVSGTKSIFNGYVDAISHGWTGTLSDFQTIYNKQTSQFLYAGTVTVHTWGNVNYWDNGTLTVSSRQISKININMEDTRMELGNNTNRQGSQYNLGYVAGLAGLGGDYASRLKTTFRLTNGTHNGSQLSPKLYLNGWNGGSVADITTYSVSKLGVNLSNLASVVGTYLAYDQILNGEPQTLPYVDAGVGTVGVASTISNYLWGAEIPYVGEFVMFYGITRVTWDTFYNLGAQYGPLTYIVNKYDLHYK